MIELKARSANQGVFVVICEAKQNCFQSGFENCESWGFSHIFCETVPDFGSIKLKRSLTMFNTGCVSSGFLINCGAHYHVGLIFQDCM